MMEAEELTASLARIEHRVGRPCCGRIGWLGIWLVIVEKFVAIKSILPHV